MRIKHHSSYRLNFFYRRVLGTFIFACALFAADVSAMQLSGVYTSACQRDIGIILDVDDTKIKLLDLNGDTKVIKRYEIIYIAHYPIGKIKVPKIDPSEDMQITEVKTLYKNEIVELADGWMTNYSDEKISFFTANGKETIIDIDDIWDISFRKQKYTISLSDEKSSNDFFFVHPYPFEECNNEEQSDMKIYPQHLLETHILIKKELDRLQYGYEELQKYVKEKVFYPKPQIFTNITTLGIWSSANLRYGSSNTRNSNYIPAVRNELSEGLYKFQRVIVTGADTMPFSVHEEPQTQFYYAMKASYFHMSFMYDLNRFITSDYKWQKRDLNSIDDRQNDLMNIALGFDYKKLSIELSIVDIKYSIRYKELFFQSGLTFMRWGFFYTDLFYKVSVYNEFGGREEEEFGINNMNYDFSRINLDFASVNDIKVSYSFIYKTTEFEKAPDFDGLNNYMYESKSITNALYLNYDFKDEDIFIKSFISYERLKNRAGIEGFTDENKYNYFKGGIGLGLVF